MRYRSAFLGAVLALGVSTSARTQELGTIDFPTSGSPAAQPAFLKGVLLMHSFEYDDARRRFRRGAESRPRLCDGLLGRGDDLQSPGVAAARLARPARRRWRARAPTPDARLAKAPTEREKDWLRAVDILYGPGEKLARDLAYADAMKPWRQVSGRRRGGVVLRARATRHQPRRPRRRDLHARRRDRRAGVSRRIRTIPARRTT